jgi:hypothetical protein
MLYNSEADGPDLSARNKPGRYVRVYFIVQQWGNP